MRVEHDVYGKGTVVSSYGPLIRVKFDNPLAGRIPNPPRSNTLTVGRCACKEI